MRKNILLVAGAFLLLLVVLFFYSREEQGGIASVKLINIMSNFEPMTVTVKADCTAVWDNSSGGVLFMDPLLKTETGKITPELRDKLFAAITRNGYAVKRPKEGVEPRMMLVITLAGSKAFVNLGPSPLEEELELKKFAEIESIFAEIAAQIGAELRQAYNN